MKIQKKKKKLVTFARNIKEMTGKKIKERGGEIKNREERKKNELKGRSLGFIVQFYRRIHRRNKK